MTVDLDETCPSADVAADTLIGRSLCTNPVEVVVQVRALEERIDEPSDWSGYVQEGVASCCYETVNRVEPLQSCIGGRPIRVSGVPRTAALAGGAAGLSPVAAAWARDALYEHASVASFARLAKELRALGAPDALVARARSAARDEVRHARDAFAVASALAGEPVSAGQLAVPSRPTPSLATLAVETLRDGCINETVAALLAAERLAVATDEGVRAALGRVVLEESEHAALGWDIVAWALAVGGDTVRDALRAAWACHAGMDVDEEPMAFAFGRLGTEASRAVVNAAMRDVVAPSVAAALA